MSIFITLLFFLDSDDIIDNSIENNNENKSN